MQRTNLFAKQQNRNLGSRNRGHLSYKEFSNYSNVDWLLFSELTAQENPNKISVEFRD